jgi:hypothetical protein
LSSTSNTIDRPRVGEGSGAFVPRVLARLRQSQWASITPYAVGGVLLLAAGLKAQQLILDTPAVNGAFVPRWFRLLLVVFEVLLGVALLLGIWSHIARRVSQLLFSGFLVYSVVGLAFGARSCGCLGAVDLQPLAIAVLDLLVLVALWQWQPVSRAKRGVALVLPCIAVVALGLIPTWAWLAQAEASPGVEVSPAVLDLGNVLQGQKREFSLQIRNTTVEPTVIDRLEFSCACLGSSQTHWVLEPLRLTTLPLALDLGKEPAFTGNLLVAVKGWKASGDIVFQAQVRIRVVAKAGAGQN